MHEKTDYISFSEAGNYAVHYISYSIMSENKVYNYEDGDLIYCCGISFAMSVI